MEETLGELIPRDRHCVIVTKIGTDLESQPPCKRFGADFLERRLDASRERLKRECLDIVLLHNPSVLGLESPATTEWLKSLKQRGVATAWGVSAGTVEVAEAAIRAGADVIQVAYNALLLRDLHPLSAAIAEAKVGVLVHSVLSYGLLCGHWTAGKTFPLGDHRRDRWTPEQLTERLRQAGALRAVVGSGAGLDSPRAAALRFTLSNEQLSACLVGPKNCLQLDQLVRDAGRGPPYLSAEQHRRLRARLTTLGVGV
jgi:aryl-alcohol dehydrogenase-like predicted oxidoreductase